MSKWLNQFLGVFGLQRVSGDPVLATPSSPSAYADKVTNVSDVVYPPRDPGIPIKTQAALIADHHELLAMLRIHAAESPARFAVRFEDPITRLAGFLNTLPGSGSDAFSGAGGLLRASIETAFNSFRASDGRIFTGALGVEDRHKLEGRWRYICFAAGLMYPCGAALASMSVLNPSGGKWSPELGGITEWTGEQNIDRVYVSWTREVSKLGPAAVSGTFALTVLGRENVAWLNEGSPTLISTFLDIVTGVTSGREAIASSLVSGVWNAVQEREMDRRHQNYGRLTVGSHVSPYLIDALVGLSKAKWELNRTVLFADRTGVYLQWPDAGKHIIEFCKDKGFMGIPSTEAALLSLLVTNGLIEGGVESVAIVEIADSEGEVVAAVQIKTPSMVLADDQTLDSFRDSRPVLMSEVRARDPLAKPSSPVYQPTLTPSPAQASTEPPPSRIPERNPVSAAPAPSTLKFDELDPSEILPAAGSASDASDDDVSEVAEVPATSAAEGAPPQKVAPAPVLAPVPAPSSEPKRAPAKGDGAGQQGQKPGALVEAPEIKYSSLLPSDVSSRFRPFEAELLGRLVHVWRTKANGTKLMRACENGVAFEVALLGEYTQDPPTFLTSLGKAGFLYTAATTPAKMVYQVPITEGSQRSALCFILAHHAAKKLSIP